MPIEIHVLNATGKFDGHIDQIREKANKAMLRIQTYFDIDDMNLSINPFYSGAAPKTGIGGLTISPYRVEILLDCDRDDLEQIISTELIQVIAHEVHHSIRTTLTKPAKSLADFLVSEGLACHFESTINDGKVPSLFNDIRTLDWKDLFTHFSSRLKDHDFSFDELFLGSAQETLPKYACYWVGYNLIIQHLQYTNQNEIELVGMETSELHQCKDITSS